MAQSMFERYGGFASISKIVMAFYDKALDSDILADYFEDIDLKSLIDHQTKFVAAVMGGPSATSNQALARSHAHLAITVQAFDEMTRVFEETLVEFGVAPADIEQILGEFHSRSKYIVTA